MLCAEEAGLTCTTALLCTPDDVHPPTSPDIAATTIPKEALVDLRCVTGRLPLEFRSFDEKLDRTRYRARCGRWRWRGFR